MLHLFDLGLSCAREGRRPVIDSQLVNNVQTYRGLPPSSGALRRARIAGALLAMTLAPVLLTAQSGEVAGDPEVMPPMPAGPSMTPGGETYKCDGPHDPTLPPGETISCTCTQVPTLPEWEVYDIVNDGKKARDSIRVRLLKEWEFGE